VAAVVAGHRVADQYHSAEDRRDDGYRADELGRWPAVDPGLVDGGVAFAAGDQPAVGRECEGSRDRQGVPLSATASRARPDVGSSCAGRFSIRSLDV
jgi:hypothetical protein